MKKAMQIAGDYLAGLRFSLFTRAPKQSAKAAIDKAGKSSEEVISKSASDALKASVTPQIKKTPKEYSELLKARVDKYLNYTYDEPFATGYLHIDPKEVADVEITRRRDFFDELTGKKFIGYSRNCSGIPVYDAAGNIKRHEPLVTIGRDMPERTTFRFYNKDKKLLKEVVLDENMKPIYEDVYKDVIVDGESRVRHLSYIASLDKLTNELKPKNVKLVLRDMKD